MTDFGGNCCRTDDPAGGNLLKTADVRAEQEQGLAESLAGISQAG
jgi:hypothetical protein